MFYIIMTAYNEALPLARLLPRMPLVVKGLRVETIVVDDGSTDGTAQVARDHGCTVIRSAINQGKGASLRMGIAELIGRDFDGIIFMDADGQHDPASLQALAEPVIAGSADLVIGSRYATSTKRGNAPWNRYLVRSAAVTILRRALGTRIRDPFSGYRALTPQALQCVDLRGDRYESELEMLFCAHRHGMRVSEVPISKIYGPATSKMGARRGSFLGRVAVVWGYALTIVRGVKRRGTAVPERSTEVLTP